MTGVAKDWDLRPSDLGICPPEDDIPIMIAYTQVTALMSAVKAEDKPKPN